jgi:hypothetical protein
MKNFGGSLYSGTSYEFARSSKLVARSFFNPTRNTKAETRNLTLFSVDLANPKPLQMNLSPDIYNLLLHIHSVGRWLVLLLLLIAIFNSLVAGKRPYIRTDNRTGLILTIFADLMLLIGIVLWFAGVRGYKLFQTNDMSTIMNDATLRFYAVEHITLMLIAIILIHIGKAQGKKPIGDRAKHRRTLIFYSLALLLILISIPWPFRNLGGHWY